LVKSARLNLGLAWGPVGAAARSVRLPRRRKLARVHRASTCPSRRPAKRPAGQGGAVEGARPTPP